jgi:hypothetical protein
MQTCDRHSRVCITEITYSVWRLLYGLADHSRIHVEACDVFIFQKSVMAPAPTLPPVLLVRVVVSQEV